MEKIISLKRQARISGLLYLLLALTGLFGMWYVPSLIFTHEDASVLTDSILQHETLYRLGIISSLTCQVLFIFLVVSFYHLFKEVNRRQARLMVAVVLVAVPVAFLNEINQLAALVLLKKPELLAAFDRGQINSMVFLFRDMYFSGINIVETFWGLWLLPFGILVYQSGFIPKIFGILLIFGCFSYLMASFFSIGFPEALEVISPVTSVTGSIGEFAIIFWLLIKGVRTPKVLLT